MKKITNFIIDTSSLTASGLSRTFTVSGEKDAEFILQVFNTPTGSSDLVDFYDFTSLSFTTGFTTKNSLNVKMLGNSYNGVIKFPANASGDTYTVLLLAPPNKDTELSFALGKNSYSTTIVQHANSTLTFSPATTTSGSYQTFPTTASVGSTAITNNVIETLDWDIKNTASDAKGFGLILARQPIDTDWYFTTTETVDRSPLTTRTDTVNGAIDDNTSVTMDTALREIGLIALDDTTGDVYVFGTGVTVGTTVAAIPSEKVITLSAAMSISDGVTLTFLTANTEVIVDDLTDIVTGMYITAVSGTNAYLIGTPIITAINTDTNTLTLSIAQAFVDGITLTFQARGSSTIQEAIGANIDFSNWTATTTSATSAELTQTVRANVSGSTSVTLSDTYGVSGGGSSAGITISGVGVNNATANHVEAVTTADVGGGGTDGVITTTIAQTLTAGSIIRFTGCTQTVALANTVTVNSYPTSNRTIYLNLDNFITLGTNGS